MPWRRHDVVAHVQAPHGVSKRRSCFPLGVDRSSVRYGSRKADQALLRLRIHDLAAARVPLPPVLSEWLTAHPLAAEQSGELAGRMGWQAFRINLNTLARHGAFGRGGDGCGGATRADNGSPGV